MEIEHKKPTALIIGAGIAGIQAALDIADAGYPVYLVEREPSVGGHMAQLDKTFPTLDCSSCILTPKMVDVGRHPNITLLSYAEVVSIQGEVGAFRVTVEKKPRYVDVDSCTGCSDCTEVCPVEMLNPFDVGSSACKAIYRLFPQAIPAAFVIEKRESPCKSACPAHIPVQGYVALIAQGKFREALEQVRGAGVPFVGTLGRVCDHPCETICKRADWDEPVAICALKRFAYDAGVALDDPEPIPVQWEERVAVVGAGPAGLTAAYELTRQGYAVTVFDALPEAGGMLAVGIPAYRLPRDVLNHEVEYICALGAELRLNTPVGRDGGPSLEDLREEYDAVFLAVGAHGSRQLGVPGEELEGVLHAAPFLRQLNLGQHVQVGKRVAVIGGGNAAVDAARSALRLGAQVQLVYRRSRVEMPAIASEVEAAEIEGVKLEFLASPTQVLGEGGRVTGLECIRMELGEPDASGRRRPIPIEGSEFTLDVDTVIVAVGQVVESDGLGEVEIGRGGRLAVNPATLETTLEGVFAGGDGVTGPASVVEAVGAGIQAAESIHRHLRKLDLREGRKLTWPKPEEIVVEPEFEVRPASRQHMSELALAERLGGFEEVERGFTEEQAVAEAQRCLNCAVCSECMQCVAACKPKAIHHDDRPKQVELDVASIIVATGYDLIEPRTKPEFGYGVYPEVMTGLEFERLSSASGPTRGKVTVNGKEPKDVVFIKCVGSRDPHTGVPYCSRFCCMYTAKHAHLVRDKIPDANVTVFYMDVRAFGKGYEEFYDRVRHERVIYRRGEPSEIYRRGDKLVVLAEDTTLGKPVEVEADLVVLATAAVPRADVSEVGELLGLERSPDGFFQGAHKFRPLDTQVEGIFLAGCCEGPKDIPDTVAQGKAAAASALRVLAQRERELGG